MGTRPNDIIRQDPATAISEVFQQYNKALELLACRLLAEPYNAQKVVSEIVPAMVYGTFGEVILECIKQYEEERRYSPQSVAIALKRDRTSLINWSLRDSEIDLPAAWDMFSGIYGQKVEQQIAESVAGWIRNGLGTEEIRVEGDKIRRAAGLTAKVNADDGKADFEKELIAALDGQVIDYPAKTPLKAMRGVMPYFEPGEYCIVAARTGMGKSFFGQNCIHTLCRAGIPSAYINLENKPKHMQKRLWQMETGVFFERDMSGIGPAKMREYMEAWDRVKNYPTKIFNPGRSVNQVCNAIRNEYYERGIQLAVVDYVQLMRADTKQGRVDELGEISAELRQLALDLDIALVVFAQMNRDSEKNADKRPTLTGIRSSGDIEQDASSVLLLYRPEYYYDNPVDELGIPYPGGYSEVIIAKGRETGNALIKCRFSPILGYYDAPAEVQFSNQFPTTNYPTPDPAPAILQGARNDEDVPF